MDLINHKNEVSTMDMRVRNHTMFAHQPVVQTTNHLSECEWCTPHAHHIAIQFCTHTPVHNIPKCDVCGTVVVVVVLSILWMWCLVVVWQNGMVHHHHLLTK